MERQHRLESHLVAALQFEQPEAGGWGSPRLVSTGVEEVAIASPRLDVFAGFSRVTRGSRAGPRPPVGWRAGGAGPGGRI